MLNRMGLGGLSTMVALMLAGCGGDGVSYAEVTGTVKLKGAPLDKIQVEFFPTSKGQPSVAITDAQGKYVLKGPRGNGAAVGLNKVTLKDTNLLGTSISRKNETVDLGKGKTKRISDDLGNVQKTNIEKEVKSGKNTIDIDL